MSDNSKESLEEIARRNGTDKSSLGAGGWGHNYCVAVYEELFKGIRDSKLNMLEIGVSTGLSLKTWVEYFSQASKIIGLDNNAKDRLGQARKLVSEYDNVVIFEGSQSDPEVFKRIREECEFFELIIDDGSHLSGDQIASFENLFSAVELGGLYIIEDIETSYRSTLKHPQHNGGWCNSGNVIEYFKEIVDWVNCYGRCKQSYDVPNEEGHMFQQDIASITFYRNLIVIRKKNRGYWIESGSKPY